MTNYSVLVKIEGQSALRQLAQQDYSLCLAFGVEDDEPRVIASSSILAPYVKTEWNDGYGIAASDSRFMEGALVQVATEVQSIKPGQTYTLNSNWAGSVSDGGRQGGLCFNNQCETVSPIICKKIGSRWAPIYIAPRQLPRGTIQEIKLNNKVTVWFQSEISTGSMINGISGQSIEIDMSGRTNATAVFSDDYRWSLE
ncbi:hypothetical protein FAGAP_5717 [Fusarium agapanthi]|uniref:Uncharacterized protein n=1 Tax=Fusarium agapanthi TaxID=1803897 RepID=A0A9P5E6U2_9HYPO|nr:hypothetical protein FAGAP_5717 [Fusarium agapanthi]